MTSLHDYGGLLLASRLKKVSEALYTGVDDIYRRHGVTLLVALLPDPVPPGATTDRSASPSSRIASVKAIPP